MLNVLQYILIIVIMMLITIWFYRKKYRNQPPGPYGLPIVGYFPFMGKDTLATFDRLCKRYGDIMSVNLLGENYWILSSMEAIEEVYVNQGELFAGRPETEAEFHFNNVLHTRSILNNQGEEWRTQYIFLLHTLSKLGMGKSEYDATMHNLIDDLEKGIASQNGQPFDCHDLVSLYAWNVSACIINSNPHNVDDQEYVKLRTASKSVFFNMSFYTLLLTGNMFKFWQRFTSPVEEYIKKSKRAYFQYAKRLVDERLKTFDANNCRDILDYWIAESRGPDREHFKPEYIANNISSVIFGAQTPSAQLYHLVYYMAAIPDIQRKVYEEIVDTIGLDAEVSSMDRTRMHYTQAVIAELFRYISTFSLTHWSNDVGKVGPYHVPKRQKVFINNYTMMRDPKHFPYPDEFDPRNFLDDQGRYKPNKALLPFGIGFRMCPGMKLAEVAIFLALVRLVRTFKWTFGPSSSANENYTNAVIQYKVCAQKRH